MANWVTLQNGVHIDLDDPNNPLTGDGSFDSYLGGGEKDSGSKSSGGSKLQTPKMTKEQKHEKAMSLNYTTDEVFDVVDQFKAKGYATTKNADLAQLYNLNLNSQQNYAVTDMGDGTFKIENDSSQKTAAKSKAMPKTQEKFNKDAKEWLMKNQEVLAYEKGDLGYGLNGKQIGDIKDRFLKEVYGYKEDSYSFNYDTGLNTTKAILLAIDEVEKSNFR